MRKLFLAALLLIFIPVTGNSQREVPASANITDFRPVGEMRVWTFIVKDSTIGQFFSLVKDELEFAGVSALEIQQDLQLDYSKIGTPRKLQIKGSLYITRRGEYLGSNLELIPRTVSMPTRMPQPWTTMRWPASPVSPPGPFYALL